MRVWGAEMRFTPTALAGVFRVDIEPIMDDRGFFARAWCRDEFAAAGVEVEWAQANVAHNPTPGTLRGMHFQQEPHAEAKLVRCTRGRLYDVALDLRDESPTYGRWVCEELTSNPGEMLFIPPGCAHGYLTLEANTDVLYLTSAPYRPDAASGVRYNDQAFEIDWGAPIVLVSEQDRAWPLRDVAAGT